MSAGTLALTNGSTAVNGTGTNFTTELSAGDFVYVTVGGAPYTLVVASIATDTSLNLSLAFDGPTTSALAWNAVPASLRVAITQKVLNDFAMVARGMIQEKANWQQIYTGTGNVTVKLPDGTSFTGPAWNGITTTLAGKAGKGANSDITSLSGLSTALSIDQGGTGAKTGSAAWKALLDARTITVARSDLSLGFTDSVTFGSMELYGNTPFIDFHFGNSSADYNVRLINSASGVLQLSGMLDSTSGFSSRQGTNGTVSNNYPWTMYWNDAGNTRMGLFIGGTRVGSIAFDTSSDKELKKDIEYITEAKASEEISQWRPATFKYKARGIVEESDTQYGFIANDLVQISPECVRGSGLPDDYDIEKDPNNTNAYYLDQMAIIVKMVLAIQEQQQVIAGQNDAISSLQNRIAALEGAGS